MPIAEVTERPSGRWLRVASDLSNYYARRVFDVVYAANEADAIAAVAAHFGVGVGSFHDLTQGLRCCDVYAVCPNFTVWNVTAEYKVFTGSSGSPLNQPPRIRWTPGLESTPSDLDVNGNAMLNAAGDPFDPPPSIDIQTWTLVVTRYQPYYDPKQYAPFIGNSNSDNFGIKGPRAGITILPGEARCMGVLPAGDYTLLDTFVLVEFAFQFRPSLSDGQLPGDSWDIREINKGYNGWYSSGGKTMRGKITSASEPLGVSTPVLLDDKGMPVDTDTYKVANNTPVANPNPIDTGPHGKGARFEKRVINGQTVWIVHYSRTKLLKFTGLL